MKKSFLCAFIIIAFAASLFAQTNVFGSVHGHWTIAGSPYNVIGDINVPESDSLFIAPGVRVVFQGHYGLTINNNSKLRAIGTEEDSIIFTAQDTAISASGWNGISFLNSSDECALQYCRIEFSKSDHEGGAIRCQQAFLSILNCRLQKNSAYGYSGGAICCTSSDSIRISESVIEYNYAGFCGGGILINCYEDIVIRNCIIGHNDCRYNPSSYWVSTSGGGIDCGNNLTLVNCVITNGSLYSPGSNALGAGVSCAHHLTLINCNVSNNNARGTYGAGVYSPDLIAMNCIFYNNYQGDILSDIYSEGYGFVSFCNVNPSACSEEIELGFGNIYTDPHFKDTLANDFSLDSISLCIDAGISMFIHAGDTFSAPTTDIRGVPRPQRGGFDMGAYEFPDSSYIPPDTIEVLYTLYPGWNLIGAPVGGIAATYFATYSEIILPAFGYNVFSGSYYIADSLEYGFGYWLLALDTVEIATP